MDCYNNYFLLDIIPGIDLDATPSTAGVNFGLPRRRNPDALPPADWLEVIGEWTYYVMSGLGRGNAVFAIKAGIMTGTNSHYTQRIMR